MQEIKLKARKLRNTKNFLKLIFSHSLSFAKISDCISVRCIFLWCVVCGKPKDTMIEDSNNYWKLHIRSLLFHLILNAKFFQDNFFFNSNFLLEKMLSNYSTMQFSAQWVVLNMCKMMDFFSRGRVMFMFILLCFVCIFVSDPVSCCCCAMRWTSFSFS